MEFWGGHLCKRFIDSDSFLYFPHEKQLKQFMVYNSDEQRPEELKAEYPGLTAEEVEEVAKLQTV